MATHVNPNNTGTSVSGPMVAARACSESTPKTAIATAIASSYSQTHALEWLRSRQGKTHKVVTCCCERLDDGHLVSKYACRATFPSSEIIDEEERRRPHDDKVEDLRYEYAKDGA